jgi:hypothetical protein
MRKRSKQYSYHPKLKSFKFNPRKFQETVLLILAEYLGRRPLSLDTLGNLLWSLDSSYYIRHGRPITGARYVKTEGGIFPRELMKLDLNRLFKVHSKKKGKR